MKHDPSPSDLIRSLGGPTATARRMSVPLRTVCRWQRGEIGPFALRCLRREYDEFMREESNG